MLGHYEKKSEINKQYTSLAGIYVDQKYGNIFMLYLIKYEWNTLSKGIVHFFLPGSESIFKGKFAI